MGWFSIVAQGLAGLFLGFVGLILAGDYYRWYRAHYPEREAERMTVYVAVLLIYAGALAIVRYVH